MVHAAGWKNVSNSRFSEDFAEISKKSLELQQESPGPIRNRLGIARDLRKSEKYGNR